MYSKRRKGFVEEALDSYHGLAVAAINKGDYILGRNALEIPLGSLRSVTESISTDSIDKVSMFALDLQRSMSAIKEYCSEEPVKVNLIRGHMEEIEIARRLVNLSL